MTCNIDRIKTYTQGRLNNPTAAIHFFEHLEHCSRCREIIRMHLRATHPGWYKGRWEAGEALAKLMTGDAA